LCGVAEAQTRGLGVRARTKQGKEVPLYSGYRALVIGVGDYEYCPTLPKAVDDAREVAAALEELGFEVTLAVDPDADELRELFKKLAFEIGAEKDAGVLVYYAGHGETASLADGSELGYLLPIDCPLKAEDPAAFDEKAVSMKEIEATALKASAKHVLMLFDSCFSGSIFSITRAMPKDITEKTARPVRQFITAGKEDEEVPDKSIFKRIFLEAIQGEADLNGDGYVTGTELGMHLDSSVVNYSNGAQHPQFGKIRNPSLDKGDFVFVVRDAEEEARLKAEEEARLKAEAEARLKAEAEARKKAEEEERKRWEEQKLQELREAVRLETEEKARLQAEEEARLKAEEEARKEAEGQAILKAKEEAHLRAEAEAKLKAEKRAREEAERQAILKAKEEARQAVEDEFRLSADAREQRDDDEDRAGTKEAHPRGFKLSPSVRLSYGYDSNVFLEDETDFEEPDASHKILIVPAVTLERHSGSKSDMVLNVQGLLEYFVSDDAQASEESNFGGTADLDVTLVDRNSFALSAQDHFAKSRSRREFQFMEFADRLVNEARIAADYRPSETAVVVRGGYVFGVDLFLDDVATYPHPGGALGWGALGVTVGSNEKWGDILYHGFSFDSEWSGVGPIHFVADGRWQMRDYLIDGHGYYGELTDSYPLHARIGAKWFVTDWASVLGMVGYGNSFTEPRGLDEEARQETPNADDSFSDVIWEGRLSLENPGGTSFQVGWVHDYADSLFSNYVAYNTIYLRWADGFGRLAVKLGVSYSHYVYAQLPRDYLFNPQSDAVTGLLGSGWDRADIVLAGEFGAELALTDYLGVELRYELECVNEPFNSDAKFGTRVVTAEGVFEDYLAYNRSLLLLGAVLHL